MRGRGAALVIGMKAGEAKAQQQAAAQQKAAADGAAQQKAASEAAAAAAAPVAAADPTEQLKKLAELHDQGVISDEEFAAAKKKALGI